MVNPEPLLRTWPLVGLLALSGVIGTSAAAARSGPSAHTERLVDCTQAILAERQRSRGTEPEPALAGIARNRVERHLRLQTALRERWGETVSRADVHAEIERIASTSRDPERLERLWNILDNDPALIDACLIRPQLVEARARRLFDADETIHGEQRRHALRALAAENTHTQPIGPEATVVTHRWIRAAAGLAQRAAEDRYLAEHPGVRADLVIENDRWSQELANLAAGIGVEPEELRPGLRARLEPTAEHERVVEVLAIDEATEHASVELRTLLWPRKTFDSWWSEQAHRFAPNGQTQDPVSALPGIAVAQSASSSERGIPNWRALETLGAPAARWDHTMVWTGAELIVWGGTNGLGLFSSGARYDPVTNSWTPLSTVDAPSGRRQHGAVYIASGGRMAVWGGLGGGGALGDGAYYQPSSDTWTPIETNGAPAPRYRHVFEAGAGRTLALVWGGRNNSGYFGDGAVLDGDEWIPLTTSLAPSARADVGVANLFRGVSSRASWFLWGGRDASGVLGSGALLTYLPTSEVSTWSAVTGSGAPTPRADHVTQPASVQSVSTLPSGVLVWGGSSDSQIGIGSGAIYDPSDDEWLSVSSSQAPAARSQAGSTQASDPWTFIWGGVSSGGVFNSGATYNSWNDRWTPTTTSNAPTAAFGVATGPAEGTSGETEKLAVWGGQDATQSAIGTGATYELTQLIAVGCERRIVLGIPGLVGDPNECVRIDTIPTIASLTLSCPDASGYSCSFLDDSSLPDDVLEGSGARSRLLVAVDASTPPADLPLTVSASDGAITRLYRATLRVQDFDLSCPQQTLTLGEGEIESITCEVEALNGFAQELTFFCTPTAGACSFDPVQLEPAMESSALEVTIDASALGVGEHSLTLVADSTTASRTEIITVQVGSSAGLIFADGFESGSTGEWN